MNEPWLSRRNILRGVTSGITFFSGCFSRRKEGSKPELSSLHIINLTSNEKNVRIKVLFNEEEIYSRSHSLSPSGGENDDKQIEHTWSNKAGKIELISELDHNSHTAKIDLSEIGSSVYDVDLIIRGEEKMGYWYRSTED